jgi:glycosyltransferase involved in cell wall biosynthesis
VTRRLGAVGTAIYPSRLDPSSGDVQTWAGVGSYLDEIAVIAQTEGLRLRRERVGNVQYILLPRLPRAVDFVAFPVGATLASFVLYLRGIRTWTCSDPLRSGLVGLALRCLPGVHLVVQLQGQLLRMPSNRFGRATGLVEAVSRFVARRADTIRAVSRQIAEEAVATGIPQSRIALVPSRCDTDLFDPDRWEHEGRAIRAAVPGDPGSPIVGFVGSFNASKGLDVLIQATSKLARDRSLRVAIAGDGPLRKQLEDAAATLPIALLGRLPSGDVPRFLAAVDVLTVPSYDEGLPRVVLEAMAMRVPVVATRVGGIPEAVEDGRSGLLIPSGDANALVAAVTRVLDDPAFASRLGDAGRDRVLKEFDARGGWRRLAAAYGQDAAARR